MAKTEISSILKYVVLPLIAVCALAGALFYLSTLSTERLLLYARIAPVVTAVIAFFAALGTALAIFVQRDTAKRRAAVDFFLKTETDTTLIKAYHDFQTLVPQIPAILSRANLVRLDPDCTSIETWLRICELIAVGVNRGAFSKSVTLAYWGDVLPATRRDASLFIRHVRTTPGWGSPATYCDLDILCLRWGYE